jgi:hypothetical protein
MKAQPTGFAISGTNAPVLFELYIKGAKTKASYAGPQGGGPVVQLNTCTMLEFRQGCALEDAIGSQTCLFDADMSGINNIPLGVHFLIEDAINLYKTVP